MANHDWMQREEEQFLRDPGSIFGARHHDALRTIRKPHRPRFFRHRLRADGEGNLVVFEVNASMLVHDENPEFPYEDPFIRRIKAAFDAMLAQIAATSCPGLSQDIL